MNRPKYIVVHAGRFTGFVKGSAYIVYVDRGEYYEQAMGFDNLPTTREEALKKCELANKAIAEGTL